MMNGASSHEGGQRPRAATRLKAQRDTIIQCWTDRVRQAIPAASAQDEHHLKDSLPRFLERMTAALMVAPHQTAAENDLDTLAQAHGKQRSGLKEYSLQQMLREYQLLREVIFQVLEQDGPLLPPERDIILSLIEQGMAEAGAGYIRFVQSRERSIEEHFRSLMETIPHVVWLCASDGRIEFVSRQWTEWTGRPSGAEGGGPSFTQALHPDDVPALAETVRQARESRGPLRLSYRVKRRDGTFRWCEARGNPVFNDDGHLRGWIGTTTDVDDQRSTDDALKAVRLELQEVFMQAPAPMVVMSGPEHRFTLVNPLYERLVNQDVLGVPLRTAFPGEQARILPIVKQVYETGQPYTWPELPVTLPDAQGVPRQHYLNASYTPLKDTQGIPRAVSCLMVDVTEQVEGRRHIEQSEARFRQIANALPQIVWTANADFFVDWYNDWWFQYLGLPRSTRWDDVDTQPMHPEDAERTRLKVQEALATGSDFLMEQRFRRGSDGQYRWHLVRGVAIRDAEGRVVGWIGANTDIHDQKTATARLEEERDLRERFVATLTHDLRTPLTAAKLNAQMLARKGDDPTALFKLAARISENLDRADQMIRDLLDANRIRAGEGITLDLSSELDLGALARETLEELALVHGGRFVLNAPQPLAGHWSRDGMRRILENLCGNAIKYGAHDRPVTVSLTEAGPDAVALRVHNWGNPIPPEHQRALFQQYRRLESAEVRAQKGWGLGLTLVEGLAQAHRGSVTLESTPETGTTFTVTVARDPRR
ncbi:PAS domain S-box protein [Corallococcus aberystwythensis]|uniref:histidine kinase n=1 Tax=Corallococcus aberystwythensis TaxID=2316722 RepID=A0A3A8QA87_9BACT|nr:PAS domain S-box protein [Corallococcus aberystwythensis]RKH65567.1 PAS domain S-box protein [Corallococcus aberystwythensis]